MTSSVPFLRKSINFNVEWAIIPFKIQHCESALEDAKHTDEEAIMKYGLSCAIL